MPSSGRPIGDEDYEQVRRLHGEGFGRNEIARRIHRSGRTVSKLAEEMGLSFDRGPTEVATEARKADGRARRAALALALLEDAERMRKQLFAPVTVYNFGGKDNTFEQALINEPSFRDKREIMTAVGIAIDRSVRLDEYDSGASLGQVVSLLDRLGASLTAKYGSGDDEHPVDAEAPNGG